jgi:hypothetical protein
MLHFDYTFFISKDLVVLDDEIDFAELKWQPGELWQSFVTPKGTFGFKRISTPEKQNELQPS